MRVRNIRSPTLTEVKKPKALPYTEEAEVNIPMLVSVFKS